MRHLQWFAVCLLAALPANAQWNEDGKPAPDTPARQAKGGFGAMLVLTDEPKKLMADWESPPENMPVMRTTERVGRNKVVVAFVVFTGCRPRNGVCDSSVDFSAYRPDGSLYGEQADGELWRGKAPPADKQLQLSIGGFGLRIEPEDPLGRYTIKARVRDNVAGTMLELVTTVEAVAE